MKDAIGPFRRALGSGVVGGALGGVVSALLLALIVASNSFGIAPFLYAATVIACGAAGAWLGNGYLRRRLRAFGLAETVGGVAGVCVALLALSPILNPWARNEAFVLDFVALVSLTGLAMGALIGTVAGAVLGLLDEETVLKVRPWFGLLGALIVVAVTGGSLIVDSSNIVPALAPITVPGGALAGWLAQREYLRLRPANTNRTFE